MTVGPARKPSTRPRPATREPSREMNRRRLLQAAAAANPLLPSLIPGLCAPASATSGPMRRVRPGDPAWPSDESWSRLGREVTGRLVKVQSPLTACVAAPSSTRCAQVFEALRNPYYLGDEVGLTQSLGWVDAWTSMPSANAVAAQTTQDVVAAVNFARDLRLRLVVKGGGHSYQGTSNAADSLLI